MHQEGISEHDLVFQGLRWTKKKTMGEFTFDPAIGFPMFLPQNTATLVVDGFALTGNGGY